jgi:hypothetical protein
VFFTGKLIRKKLPLVYGRCRFSRFRMSPGSTKTLKIVVRMQHTRRTFIEMVRTPKKAAHACLFCFTIVTPQTTL